MTETAAAMLGVIPVRAGVVPLGADEVVAECGGRALLIGSGCADAVSALHGVASDLWTLERSSFVAADWAAAIGATLGEIEGGLDGHLLVPGSPDGRDLGPHLAANLGRAYLAGAIKLEPTAAEITRHGGLVTDVVSISEPIVASLQPGVRGVEPIEAEADDQPGPVAPAALQAGDSAGSDLGPVLLEELPADPSTMDLAEADRIIGGGAGLGSAEAFDELRELSALLGASPGGTRVITDWGWLPVERQIGTTGVNVDPSLYIALGISGAVQHTAGLGSPTHMISVNTDPHCPMMGLADVAVVTDGPEFLRELIALLQGGDNKH